LILLLVRCFHLNLSCQTSSSEVSYTSLLVRSVHHNPPRQRCPPNSSSFEVSSPILLFRDVQHNPPRQRSPLKISLSDVSTLILLVIGVHHDPPRHGCPTQSSSSEVSTTIPPPLASRMCSFLFYKHFASCKNLFKGSVRCERSGISIVRIGRNTSGTLVIDIQVNL